MILTIGKITLSYAYTGEPFAADLGQAPNMIEQLIPVAAIWKTGATDDDAADLRARLMPGGSLENVARDGWKMFVFADSCADPIEATKGLLKAIALFLEKNDRP